MKSSFFETQQIDWAVKFSRCPRILALGTDTCQRVSFLEKNKITSFFPGEGRRIDQDDFYRRIGCLLKRRLTGPIHAILYDPHPHFLVAGLARTLREAFFPEAQMRPVFHHRAHAANFGLEHGFRKDFIAVTFDGTGYGEDGRVWGGEFFVYENRRFVRRAHLAYQPLAGNEQAIHEPWRVAFGILYKIYGRRLFLKKHAFLKNVPKGTQRLVAEMIDRDFNTPLTSSAGRLFDAACALLNLKLRVSREAEAAVALEKAASDFQGRDFSVYPLGIRFDHGASVWIVDPQDLFKEMGRDVLRRVSASRIAYQFHATLAAMTGCVCAKLSAAHGLKKVYLSGGVFMNGILSRLCGQELRARGLEAVFAQRAYTGDPGISRGQIAAYLMEGVCASRSR